MEFANRLRVVPESAASMNPDEVLPLESLIKNCGAGQGAKPPAKIFESEVSP
jgi:hypothetical protein